MLNSNNNFLDAIFGLDDLCILFFLKKGLAN